jgi:16S rRNA (guanine527-N7)-methyltransferase
MDSRIDFDFVLAPYLAQLGLELTQPQLQLLRRHHDLLVQWNRRLNLTAVRNPKEMIRRHFAESLFLAARIDFAGQTVADIGSGAGFPGFPIAVAYPTSQVTLIESAGKKATFLKEISRGVPNVQVRCERFEQGTECYDWAVLRGVALEPLRREVSRRCRNIAILKGSQTFPPTLVVPRETW